jgi:hypothetical protein
MEFIDKKPSLYLNVLRKKVHFKITVVENLPTGLTEIPHY